MKRYFIFALLVLFSSIAAWTQAPPAHTTGGHAAQCSGGNVGTITATTGNLIVVFAKWGTSANNATVSDTASNTYTAIAKLTNSNASYATEIFYASPATTGVTSITVTVTGTCQWAAGDYTNMATSAVLDTHIETQNSVSGTACASANFTTTNASDTIIGGCTMDVAATWTAGSSGACTYTNEGAVQGATQLSDCNVSATGTFTMNATASVAGNWSAMAGAFKQSGGAAPVPAGVNKRIKIENLDPISYSIDPTVISNFPGCDVTDTVCTLEIEVCDDQVPHNCLHIPADGLPHMMQAFFIAHQTIPAVQVVTSAVAAKATSVVVTVVQ